MTGKSRLRKLALTTHIIASVGWFGALSVFLALALAGLMAPDDLTLRATALAMNLTARVILPLCLATIITGVIQACAVTKWGLFRHYWVLFKFLLTAIATAVFLLKLGPIGELADAQAAFAPDAYRTLQLSLLVHAAGGLAILLAAVVLAIYKPGGMTPRGLRELRARNPVAAATALRTPFWVKITGTLILILLLLIIAMLVVGGYGPGMRYSGT